MPYKAEQGFAVDAQGVTMDKLKRSSLATVQALIPLSLHDAGRMDGAEAWMLGGMAFRAATFLGLDTED